jgi:hypothetical protein
MNVLNDSYSVALRGFPGLAKPERTAAEMRFTCALEYQFTDPDAVANTLRTVRALDDTGSEDVTSHDLAALQQWVRAATVAQVAGFRGLRPTPGAAFEVCLG